MLRPRLAALLAASVLPVAGCGGSDPSSDRGADPAQVVPASAALYAEAVVRPDGDLRSGAQDALRKLLRTQDVSARVVGLFDDAVRDDGLGFNDLRGWLGPRVGLFLTGIENGRPVGAVVADQTDPAEARAALGRLAAKAHGGEPLATAVVGDYAVLGTAAGVRAVQDTARGGRRLADVPDFAASRRAVAADSALAGFYADPQGILDLLARAGAVEGPSSPGERSLGAVRRLLARAGRAVAGSLQATGEGVLVRSASLGAPPGAGAGAATMLAGLPADAWLGVALGDVGRAGGDLLAQARPRAGATGSRGGGVDALVARLQRRTGIDLRNDLLSWMGQAAIYAGGRSIVDVGGLVTIASKDAARSRRAVGLLAQGLARLGMNARPATVRGYDVAIELRSPRAPISFFVAANARRFTLGVNPQAMSDVLAPAQKLGDSAAYDRAVRALGGDVRPVAVVDTPTVVALLETFGIGQAPGYARAKPYLDALGPISAGIGREGDVQRFALAVGLR